MGEADLAEHANVGAAADPVGGGGPLPDPVDGQDRRLVERRAEEGARGVREVVIAEDDLGLVHLEVLADLALDPELLGHPGDHRFLEDAPRLRERGHGRPEDAVELQERLLEEDDHVQVLAADAARLQAEVDRPARKVVVVLLAAEALLFGGRDQGTVLDQRGAGIVEEAGDAEDVHQNCLLASRLMS